MSPSSQTFSKPTAANVSAFLKAPGGALKKGGPLHSKGVNTLQSPLWSDLQPCLLTQPSELPQLLLGKAERAILADWAWEGAPWRLLEEGEAGPEAHARAETLS